MEQNNNFICKICGREDVCGSTLSLTAGYSSSHDTEKAVGHICGDCLDWMWESLGVDKPGSGWIITNYL